MQVWVVLKETYETAYVCAVFDSEAKADDYVRRVFERGFDEATVEEWEVA